MRPRCVGGVQTTQTLPHRPDRRPSCLLNRARFGRLCVPPGRQRDRAWPRGTHSPGGLRRGAGDAATCLISADIGPLRGHSPRRAISPRCVVPTSDLRRNLVPEVADTSTPACGVQSERGVGPRAWPEARPSFQISNRPTASTLRPLLYDRYDHCLVCSYDHANPVDAACGTTSASRRPLHRRLVMMERPTTRNRHMQR